MIEIDQAIQLILSHVNPLELETVKLADSVGRTIAKAATSDIDSPPYDKSMMDGYAIQSSDLANHAGEPVVLRVIEQVTAGETPSKRVESGTATRIMTGAPIPDGADCVVMVERTERLDDRPELPRVSITVDSIRSGVHIMTRGTAMRQGDVLLDVMDRVESIHLGLLAEAGCFELSVFQRPTVAVLATGDELVDVSQMPGPGQIRNSNGPMIEAMVNQVGARCLNLDIGRDTLESLSEKIELGLACDVLILSGGVSAGVLDLVPQVLARAGVQEVFHKVRIKPGKPIWFGVCDHGDQEEQGKRIDQAERRTLVFGLPGNPVSSLVCFRLFAEAAIRKMAGESEFALTTVEGQNDRAAADTKSAACTWGLLSHPHQVRGDRPLYWPSRFYFRGQTCYVEPLAWKGSADLKTLGLANCLAVFPPEDRLFETGEVVEFKSL